MEDWDCSCIMVHMVYWSVDRVLFIFKEIGVSIDVGGLGSCVCLI